jgi:hypothetical protein
VDRLDAGRHARCLGPAPTATLRSTPKPARCSLASAYPQLGERMRVHRLSLGWRHGRQCSGGAIDKLGALLAGPLPPAPLLRAGQVALKCSQSAAASGGVDSESLDAALRRIPSELRRNHRAVARDDFAELALQTPAVVLGRAECLPLFHAPSRSRKPGTVSVVVWPARDAQHPNAPLPDAWELTQVCSWLDRWRVVTTELYVIPPTYRRIALAVSVKVRDGYGLDAVRDWVDILLRQYLAPLPPLWPGRTRLAARPARAGARARRRRHAGRGRRIHRGAAPRRRQYHEDGRSVGQRPRYCRSPTGKSPKWPASSWSTTRPNCRRPGTGWRHHWSQPPVPVPVIREDIC